MAQTYSIEFKEEACKLVQSSAFCSVRIARSLVMWRSVILATTLRSCRSIMVQLYLTS